MTQLSSGVDVKQGSTNIPKITQGVGHRTIIIGVSERGPVGVATRCSSWAEFQRIFGWHTTSADGTMGVWNFYKETGGVGEIYFIRVVHYSVGVKISVAAEITLLSVLVGTVQSNTLKVLGYSDGAYGNSIAPVISDASNGDAEYFNLGIEVSTVLVDTIPNCTMDTTSADYVETKVATHNLSKNQLITVEDQSAPGTASQRRPINTTDPESQMIGGDDGLTGLVDADFNGTAALGNGIHATTSVSQPTLIGAPGRATSSVANAIVSYNELTRGKKLFGVLDTPSGSAKAAAVTYVKTTAALKNLTQMAAVFWPWPRIDNPDTSIFGTAKTITVSPVGLVLGVFERVSRATKRGYAENPAGTEYPFYSVRGFEGEDDDRKQQHEVCSGLEGKNTRDYVFPERINPLRKDENSPFYIDGEYTLSAGDTDSWDTTGKQIAGQAVMRALEVGLDPLRHRNHDTALEQQAHDGTYDYLDDLCKDGYFSSTDPDEAFEVDYGPGQNTAQTKRAKELNGAVGIALSDPAIFVNVYVNPMSTEFITTD